MTGAYQVEKQAGILHFCADIVKMIYDQKIQAGELVDDIVSGIIGQSSIEHGKKFLKFVESDSKACITGLDAKRCGDMCFSRTCFAEDKEWLPVYNKAQLPEVFEIFHIKAGLKAPVE